MSAWRLGGGGGNFGVLPAELSLVGAAGKCETFRRRRQPRSPCPLCGMMVKRCPEVVRAEGTQTGTGREGRTRDVRRMDGRHEGTNIGRKPRHPPHVRAARGMCLPPKWISHPLWTLLQILYEGTWAVHLCEIRRKRAHTW